MGGKIRIKITVDKDTLRLADRLARLAKTSRSAIFRNGVHVLIEAEQRNESPLAKSLTPSR